MAKVQSQGGKLKLLFVDLSNTCRSPAAEAIMNSIVNQKKVSGFFEITSCSTGSGTREWYKPEIASEVEIEVADPRMVSHASKRGLNLAGRRSKVMRKDDLLASDIIILMDNQNKKDVLQAAQFWGIKGQVEGKLRALSDYCRSGTRTTEVPDPYYGGRGAPSGPVFEKVLDLLEDGCKGLLRDCMPKKA
eukprot:CAMPEP_0184316360 /NCGR_PEP_ID=MMETSP1049-20130417/89528_1 /TAXON_ID=77928 /ORGANISM="Proteomonas sulcata, Strain CCMP704" /LENGTH=189 /DNA_ID=CAMNT_0026635295 /DNA_START=515 /DNA_END=1084 /DNA_ORIENTATION=+